MCDPELPVCPGGEVRQPGLACNCECKCPIGSTNCTCPEGTGCAALATCGTHSTADLCCSYPKNAMACADSPGKHDGFAVCCEYGVDCPHCPSGRVAIAGRSNVCATPEENKVPGGSATCGPEPGENARGGDAYC
jgi:hypothetical protein